VSTQTQEPEQQERGGDGGRPMRERFGEEMRGSPVRRILIVVAAAIVLVLLLVFGIPWLRYTLSHEGNDDAYVDADKIQITSEISERIDRILVDTNQLVHRGQLLVVLDDRDEILKLQQAEAQYNLALANQRTTVQQGRGGVTQAAESVAAADAQVAVAQANLPGAEQSYATAAANLDRAESLVSTGDMPREQLDAARAAAAAAASQLHAAEDQVRAAQAQANALQGGVTTAQGRLAQAADPSQIAAAKAQVDLARQNLAYTHIHSPIDGYVGEKDAEIGQTVSAGMQILTLIPQHRIYITSNYKETQMGKIRIGDPVDIHVDAYGGVTFHGHVTSINPASENTYALVPSQQSTANFVKVVQRVPVRISIDDPRADMPLRPGMSVETYVKVQ
jgi:membrane fusion protein (multidrug efflux system)